MIEDIEAEEANLVRELVPSTDPILREVMPIFDFSNPSMHPAEVAHTLAQTCIDKNGLGLSANQIGLRVRACIIKAEEMLCMFNPTIVDFSTEVESYQEEGCLSFPNLFVKVKRPDIIRVRYTLPNGETVTKRYVGMTSKIIQHEVDHLNGILFIDRAHPMHLEQARAKKKKYDRRNKSNVGSRAV